MKYQLWINYDRSWIMEGFFDSVKYAESKMTEIEDKITQAYNERDGLNVTKIYDYNIVKVKVEE